MGYGGIREAYVGVRVAYGLNMGGYGEGVNGI